MDKCNVEVCLPCDIIESASMIANDKNVSLSEYLSKAILDRVYHDLHGTGNIVLNEEESKRFLESLDNPAEPTEALKELFA